MLKRVLRSGSIFRIQTWDNEAIAPPAAEEVLGVAWPRKSGLIASGRADVICLSPTDWLVVAVDPDPTILERWLHESLEDSSFRATNVSQALARIEVDGIGLRDLLAKACSLDLHPPLFPPGRAARTRFAGMPVILRCTGTSTFELIVTRSYADFLLSWLDDAELEFDHSTENWAGSFKRNTENGTGR
jgi:sarcosine oxidase subunit gamma